MLKPHHEATKSGGVARPSNTSSFDRWLERTQRKGHAAEGDFRPRSNHHDLNCHADPQTESWGAAPMSFSSQQQLGPSRSRLEELEGLLFTQAHFNHSHGVPDAAALQHGARFDSRYGPPYSSPPPQPSSLFVSPTQRPLQLPIMDGDLSSLGGGAGGRGDMSMLNEPFACSREPFSSVALFGGAGSEAERYIARLEEEVQMLLTEGSDRDRMAVAAVAARDAMALQLQEMRRRVDVERDEHAAAQTLTYSFLRTQSFLRLLEERSRAMELNTQISLLKHELKLAEAMRLQAQTSATTAAASSTAAQALQRQMEEQHLANSVTTTVRDLLQQEYSRLSAVMSEMPKKVQSMIDERQTKTAAAGSEELRDALSPAPQRMSPEPPEAAEQRRLCALLESALAALSAQGSTATPARAPVSVPQEAPPPHSQPAAVELTPSDSARLLELVNRAHDYQSVVLDVYCCAVDAKSSLAQYEMNIVRLIHEKQASLTWAILYEEKKDEVRHLNEKLMELRGELRAATSPIMTATGASPRGWNGVASFAGSTSSQSYEAYAAPYVPAKVAGARQQAAQKGAGLASVRVKAPKKSIAELREEARRLGAHPAVHYPAPVTSPSPSMPSLYASHTPNEVEQTLLQQRDAPEHHTMTAAAVPPTRVRSPATALIRSFPAHEDTGSSSSTASSPVPSAPQPAKTAKTPATATTTAVKNKETRPNTTAAARLPSPPTSPSSLSASSSVRSAGTPASPVPATRGLQIAMSALHRVTTTASSSSLSSGRSASATKPSLGHAASSPSPPSQPSAVAASPPKAAAAHNSFDDDNESESEKIVAPRKATTQTAAAVKASTTSATGAARTSINAKAPKPQVKRISLDETVRVLEKAKRVAAGDEDGSDADTSSLSLSMTSSSSPQLPVTKGGKASSSAASKAKLSAGQRGAAAAASTSPAKEKHPRRSSFDDEDDGEGEESGSKVGNGGSRPGQAKQAPVLSTLKEKPSITKTTPPPILAASSSRSTAPALSSVAPTAAKTEAAAVPAAATRPAKLKLPTW